MSKDALSERLARFSKGLQQYQEDREHQRQALLSLREQESAVKAEAKVVQKAFQDRVVVKLLASLEGWRRDTGLHWEVDINGTGSVHAHLESVNCTVKVTPIFRPPFGAYWSLKANDSSSTMSASGYAVSVDSAVRLAARLASGVTAQDVGARESFMSERSEWQDTLWEAGLTLEDVDP